MLKNETSFQRYAFDRTISRNMGVGRRNGGRSGDLQELRRALDGGEMGSAGAIFGFQIKNIRRQEKFTPEWARTNEGIQKVLLTAFPRLQTDSKQRKAAGRWAQVIQMYFQVGWTCTEVADELNTNLNTIKMLTRSITKTSQGLRTDCSGPRTAQHDTSQLFYGGSKRPSEPIAGDVPEGCQSLSSNLVVKETRVEDGPNSLLL